MTLRPTDTSFGGQLRCARLNAGLSTRALGERLGVSAMTVSNWERNAKRPAQPTVVALQEVLGISLMGYYLEPGALERLPRGGARKPKHDVDAIVAEAVRLRREEGLGPKALGERLGVNPHSLSAWLSNAGIRLTEIGPLSADQHAYKRRREIEDQAPSESSPPPACHDRFSPEERAAITAALEAGRVTRIENGDWPDADRPLSRSDPRVRFGKATL